MPYPISPKSGWPKSRTREPTCPPGLRWPGYSRPRSTFGAATPRMNRRYRACRSRNIRPPGCALLTEARAQGGMRGRISSRDPPQSGRPPCSGPAMHAMSESDISPDRRWRLLCGVLLSAVISCHRVAARVAAGSLLWVCLAMGCQAGTMLSLCGLEFTSMWPTRGRSASRRIASSS
jgi:hypothetical protein